jgi:hypothetical protein
MHPDYLCHQEQPLPVRLKPETVALLKRIQRQFDKNPSGFHMSWWKRQEGVGYTNPGQASFNPCGTTCCIGGWAAELSGKSILYLLPGNLHSPEYVYNSQSYYAEILGIDVDKGWRLFHQEQWPQGFRENYDEAEKSGNHEAMASVAIQRIQHFIDTHGEE